MSNDTTKQSYFEKSINSELVSIGSLPVHNINKSGSELFGAMVRIASLGKTGGLNSGKLGAAVVDAAIAWDKANGGKVQHREVWRQWRRAWNYAQPRKEIFSRSKVALNGSLVKPNG